MFEKVNPSHPDKIADRIAGAIVDLAYNIEADPRVAVEVLIGHGVCRIIAETSVDLPTVQVEEIVSRIAGKVSCLLAQFPQDALLADNQSFGLRAGDNGIFRGVPVTEEQWYLTQVAKDIYDQYPSDGKYILDRDRLIICQSRARSRDILAIYSEAEVNPIGEWSGGLNVDTGATNRKLGSDMGDSVTGGGLHGKDLSKADVSVNIYAWIKAQKTGRPVELCTAIGDRTVDGKPYHEIVEIARDYIKSIGGFEKFAEWGLIR